MLNNDTPTIKIQQQPNISHSLYKAATWCLMKWVYAVKNSFLMPFLNIYKEKMSA